MGVFHSKGVNMFNKDFGKAASDLISKDFPGQLEVEVATKNANLDVTTNMDLNPDGTFAAKLKPTFKVCDCSKVEVTLDTEGNHSTKVTATDLVKNLKSSLSINCARLVDVNGQVVHTQSVTADADYTYNRGTASLKLAFPSLSVCAPRTTLAFVYLYDKFAFGAEGVLSFGESTECEKVSANVEYKQMRNILSVGASSSKGVVDASVKYFYVHDQFLLGTRVNWSGEKQAASADVAFAKPMRDGGVGKLVFNTNGVVGLSYKKQICANSVLTVGTKVNVDNLQQKTGVALSFNI